MTHLSPTPRVAVIGAGLTGMVCASRLRANRLAVTVFEKARGPGGRMATRRGPDDLAFDHGCQFVTARTPGFQDMIRQAVEIGAAGTWRPAGAGHGGPRFVGVPGMNALLNPLLPGTDLRLSCEVTAVARDGDGYRVETAEMPAGQAFDAVVCTAPPVQAQRLLASEAALVAPLAAVTMAPCWTLMVAFAEPLDLPVDVLSDDVGTIAWAARDSHKPGRRDAYDCWVVHAGSQWSRDCLELEHDDVTERLLDAFAAAAGRGLPATVHATAHRWRFARTVSPLGTPYLASTDGRLLVGGDWCQGARAEYAFQSGQAMADGLLRSLAPCGADGSGIAPPASGLQRPLV